MEFKVGDKVVPQHAVGTITEVSDNGIKIAVPKGTEGDTRTTTLTKEQASKMNLTLKQLIETYVIKVKVL